MSAAATAPQSPLRSANAGEQPQTPQHSAAETLWHLTARMLDGREFDLEVFPSAVGRNVVVQVAENLGIGPARVRLVTPSGSVLDRRGELAKSGVQDGDALTVVVLQPLYGNLHAAGVHVPDEVLAAKLEVHGALATLMQDRRRAVEEGCNKKTVTKKKKMQDRRRAVEAAS